MITTEMDTEFARGVRAELAAIGTTHSALQRNQRRTRTVALGVGALVLAGATTGAALVIYNFPGATTVAAVGSVVSATHTGSASIDLGPAPVNASVVILDLTCVSESGQVSLETTPTDGDTGASGVSMDCSIGHTMHVSDGLLPRPGTTSIDIVAEEGTTWTATAQYASSATTAWATNANGQTYGVPNVHGAPDLTPALATNGKHGYLFAADLLSREAGEAVYLYESDGETIVGQFDIQEADDIAVDESLIPTLPLGTPTSTP